MRVSSIGLTVFRRDLLGFRITANQKINPTMTDLTTLTDAELDALPAAIEVERKRRAEIDRERYREMLNAFTSSCNSYYITNQQIVEGILAARNHDPDVVEMVRWAREAVRTRCVHRANEILAPFASITDKD